MSSRTARSLPSPRRRAATLPSDQGTDLLANRPWSGSMRRSARRPALTKQRGLLLRRVSALIGGPECRVVLAMSTARSLDRVGTQLGLSPLDVARLQRQGLHRLQTQLDHDAELMRQLTGASRQPRRARTYR